MIIKNIKNKIIYLLITSLFLASPAYAGQWIENDFGRQYLDDSGKLIAGWRWLDVNNDGIMECYRFSQNGILLTNAIDSNNRHTNEYGQWVEEGVVQQIYQSTRKPLSTNKVMEMPKAEISTDSVINATGWDIYDVIKEIKLTPDNTTNGIVPKATTITRRSSSTKKTTVQQTKRGGDPRSVFSPSNAGYIIGNKAKVQDKSAPNATFQNEGNIIDTTKEDEIKYLENNEVLIAGRDMTKMVTSSNKFLKSVKNVRIWGNETWEEAMQLSGNGASVKFNMTKPSGGTYNWFRMEVAHQTHGESTADTNVVLELYIGGELVAAYDAFNDDKPELIEEWNDDEKTVELKLSITGDALGRKVYIRNARARSIKEES